MTSTRQARERRRTLDGTYHPSLGKRIRWRLSDWTYRHGWAAELAHRVGLQRGVAVRQHTFELPRAAGKPTLRMVFASDFHAGPLTHPALIDEACRAIAAAAPDLLLLGGDFVYRRARDVDVLAQRLGALAPPLGTFGVIGNHDTLGDQRHIVARLERAGVTMLVNRNVQLPAPHDDVWVCGLDDPVFGVPDAVAALEGATGTRLLLMHAPDGLLALEGHRFDLALCGHTHGGQVALPFGIPIVLPKGRLSRRYSAGEYALPQRDARLLVSRGIGCSGVPVRLFAQPEVHVCALLPAARTGVVGQDAA